MESAISIAWDFQYRLSTLVNAESGFGLKARFALWEFAINRLDGFVPWFGNGFDYMDRFSCEFAQCGGTAYPHMPVLSAFLYGGVIAAIATCALYVYIIAAGFRLLSREIDFAWLFFPLICTLLFAAISGNGPMSIRSFIVVGAVCVGFLRASRADAQKTF